MGLEAICDCVSNCLKSAACNNYYLRTCCPCCCCCHEQQIKVACYTSWYENCPPMHTCLKCKPWSITMDPDSMMACDDTWTIGAGTCWMWTNDSSVGTFRGVYPTGSATPAKATCGDLVFNCPTTTSTVNVTAWTDTSGRGIDSDGRHCTSGTPSGYYYHADTNEWIYLTEAPWHFRADNPEDDFKGQLINVDQTAVKREIFETLLTTTGSHTEDFQIKGKLINSESELTQSFEETATEGDPRVTAQSHCTCDDLTIKVHSNCCLWCWQFSLTNPLPDNVYTPPCDGSAASLYANVSNTQPTIITATITGGGCCGPFVATYEESDMMMGDGSSGDFPFQITSPTVFTVNARPQTAHDDCVCSNTWCRNEKHCGCAVPPSCSSAPMRANTLYLYKKGKFYLNQQMLNQYQTQLAARKQLAPKYTPSKKSPKLM